MGHTLNTRHSQLTRPYNHIRHRSPAARTPSKNANAIKLLSTTRKQIKRLQTNKTLNSYNPAKDDKSRLSIEGQTTYAVGHLALGYLSGKATSKLLNVNVNIPLLFLASIIPDIDLLIPGVVHRGPTHSLIISILIFIPVVTFYGKKAVPYFVAFTQHSLIGDYITSGGIQLLWPVNSIHYCSLGIEMTSLTNILLEWIFFLISFTILLKTRDAWRLFQPHSSNLILSVAMFTVLLPTLISFPTSVPLALIIPHLIYFIIFTVSLLIDFKAILKKS